MNAGGHNAPNLKKLLTRMRLEAEGCTAVRQFKRDPVTSTSAGTVRVHGSGNVETVNNDDDEASSGSTGE